MTDLENAAIAYVQARAERDKAKNALRAGWYTSERKCFYARIELQDGDGWWSYQGDVCYRSRRDSSGWCEVCARRQALYLAHQSATRRMCGAWLHLRAVARKIGGDI